MGRRGVKENTISPQIIDTSVIKTTNLTVKTIRPDLILKNTTYKKKFKYAPILTYGSFILPHDKNGTYGNVTI